MRLLPASVCVVPERTAALAHAAFPHGNRSMPMGTAVQELNHLEIVGDTLHHVLHVLAQAALEWVCGQVSAA